MTHVSLFKLFLRKAHHNIYPSSDLLLTSWHPIISVFKVVWNFLIKYRDVYLWWNIKYFSLGQRAISSKRHNSPFFGLLKPRWLFIFVMQSDPRAAFTLCFTSLQSTKHHCNPSFRNWKFGPFSLLNLKQSDMKYLLELKFCIRQHTQNTSRVLCTLLFKCWAIHKVEYLPDWPSLSNKKSLTHSCRRRCRFKLAQFSKTCSLSSGGVSLPGGLDFEIVFEHSLHCGQRRSDWSKLWLSLAAQSFRWFKKWWQIKGACPIFLSWSSDLKISTCTSEWQLQSEKWLRGIYIRIFWQSAPTVQ